MTWCFISPRRQNVERTNRFANAIAKEHNVPISCPSKMDDDSIVACFLDEGGLSILIRALLTYELKSQQGPDQNSQATLIQKAFDDAVFVLLPPYEARRCDLQIVMPVGPGFLCAAMPDLRSARRGRGVGACSSFARTWVEGFLAKDAEPQPSPRHLWPRTLQLHLI